MSDFELPPQVEAALPNHTGGLMASTEIAGFEPPPILADPLPQEVAVTLSTNTAIESTVGSVTGPPGNSSTEALVPEIVTDADRPPLEDIVIHNSWLESRTRKVINRALGWVGLVAAAPAMAVIYASLKLQAPDQKAILRLERIGKDGEVFDLFKFRSYATDEDHGTIGQGAFDQNATGLRALYRVLAVDELPQIANVAFGQMTWNGVRPINEPYREEMENNLGPQSYPLYFKGYCYSTPGFWSKLTAFNRGHTSADRTRSETWFTEAAMTLEYIIQSTPVEEMKDAIISSASVIGGFKKYVKDKLAERRALKLGTPVIELAMNEPFAELAIPESEAPSPE